MVQLGGRHQIAFSGADHNEAGHSGTKLAHSVSVQVVDPMQLSREFFIDSDVLEIYQSSQGDLRVEPQIHDFV
jgi:hypothetical protein